MLDSNQEVSGNRIVEDGVLAQNCVEQGLGEGREGQGVELDVSETAPPSGGTAIPPMLALDSCSASQPASQIEQVRDEDIIARKRGKDERVAFLDSNQDKSGSKDGGDDELPQDGMDPGLVEDDREGCGVIVDKPGTAPSGGGTDTAPSTALHSSPASQPASQQARLRMSSKIYTNTVSSNVTLGLNAGAGPSRGGGREERVGVQVIPEPGSVGGREERARTDECVHNKEGTCTLHGPGAKWRWRPILPVSSRPVGPDGKVKKREYYWQCEVGSGGKNLQQARISFKKKPDGGNKKTMGYQV